MVTVVLSGKGDMRSIKIDPSSWPTRPKWKCCRT
jgi:DNA-binding protein YbaB